MNRRGQGISVNMMILIVLGLVVLIIAVLMITKSGRTGNNAFNDALDCGGTTSICGTPNSNEECSSGERVFKTCKTAGEICCTITH